MKFCSKCGAQLVDEAVICPQCGCAASSNFSTESSAQPENTVWGTLAIVFGALGGWLGLVFSIVGLCQYKLPENKKKCYIGLGLFIGWTILAIVFYAIIMASLPSYI